MTLVLPSILGYTDKMSNSTVVKHFFFLLSLLHYRGVILHAGIHLCFFFVIGDAVTVSVSEFPVQLQLLQRLLCTFDTWSQSTEYLSIARFIYHILYMHVMITTEYIQSLISHFGVT